MIAWMVIRAQPPIETMASKRATKKIAAAAVATVTVTRPNRCRDLPDSPRTCLSPGTSAPLPHSSSSSKISSGAHFRATRRVFRKSGVTDLILKMNIAATVFFSHGRCRLPTRFGSKLLPYSSNAKKPNPPSAQNATTNAIPMQSRHLGLSTMHSWIKGKHGCASNAKTIKPRVRAKFSGRAKLVRTTGIAQSGNGTQIKACKPKMMMKPRRAAVDSPET
mmetsp:Transcript_25220/g.71111  ORF Transcript_25220/g.71111 Transcript_25220/m.71111 type:complete len:220 (-) Transcript_25220:103-762(-)